MAYSTISKSSSFFNTVLYTGANQTITGVGFQPDWSWIKQRNSASSALFDAVRGATKFVESNSTNVEVTDATTLTAFGSDGFTLGADSSGYVGGSSQATVSWNWKANGSGSANSDGSITTTATSVNTTSGFSISTYTGTGSAATIGHGLGVAPAMIMVKRLNASAEAWVVYQQNLGGGTTPQDKYLHLSSSDAEGDSAGMWNDTAPTTSVFSVGSTGVSNGAGGTFVAYCFAEKTGFSKFGSYVGNGNANGAMIYTGFKPAFVMIKRTDASDNWNMFDDKRVGYNYSNYRLFANSTSGEETSASAQRIDIVSNGFKLRSNETDANGSGNNYIYMAFGQPIVSTNGDIATAR